MTSMTLFRSIVIAGSLAASVVLTAGPAAALGGMRPWCPGWFPVMAYTYCVGRPAVHARYVHYYRRHRAHVVRTRG